MEIIKVLFKFLLDFLLDAYLKWQQKKGEAQLKQGKQMSIRQASAKEKLRVIKERYAKLKKDAPDNWPDDK